MNARTRSDILAAASGMTASKAARTLAIGATDDTQRVAIDALEFAIESAREDVSPSRDDLIRENAALKSKLDKIGTMAAEIYDMTEDP